MTIQELQAVSEAIANRAEQKYVAHNPLVVGTLQRSAHNFCGDSATVEPTKYGFTVYRLTRNGYRWAEVTFGTPESAEKWADTINAARAEVRS